MRVNKLSTKYHVDDKGNLICSTLELSSLTTEETLFIDVQILLEHFKSIALALMYYNVY